MERRLLLLSGLSGDGKRPLLRFWDNLDPMLLADRPCVYTSRRPDPGEIRGDQFACLAHEEVLALGSSPHFIVQQIRSDVQAIDFEEVERLVRRPGVTTPVFVEVFYTLAQEIERRARQAGIPCTSIFLIPGAHISDAEVKYLTLKRIILQGRNLAPEDLIDRAETAPEECRAAENYTFRMLNTAGEEDIEEWGECGMHKGQQGRPVLSLEDLGPRAKWLASTFRDICDGKIAPVHGSSVLISPG